MITRWGMSDELGTIAFGEDQEQVFLGRDLGHSRNYSEAIAFSIDKEVKRIMDECHQRAHDMLNEHRDKLDAVAMALQEREVLNAFEFQGVMDGKSMEQIDQEEAEYLAKLNEEKQRKIAEQEKLEKEKPPVQKTAAPANTAAEPFSFEQWVRAGEQPKAEKPQTPAEPAVEEKKEEALEAQKPWDNIPTPPSDQSSDNLGLPSQQNDDEKK